MSNGERAAVEGVLSRLKPGLAIEIGTAEGATLGSIAGHATEVHSFDLFEPTLPAGKLEHVTIHTGDSHELLPQVLADFAGAGRNVDFVLVDGDHSSAGVKRDLEDLLASPALSRTTILIHDVSNPTVRSGLEAVDYTAYAKVVAVELDWITGYVFSDTHFDHELWGGLGCVTIDATGRPEPGHSPVEGRYAPIQPLLESARKVILARAADQLAPATSAGTPPAVSTPGHATAANSPPGLSAAMRLCTIVTKDRLPWARVLTASWAEHHPGHRAVVLLVDEPEGCFDPAEEPFDVLTAEEVVGPGLWAMALRYTPFELAMALKPFLLMHQLGRHELVVHLDSDVLVMAPLEPVVAALERCQIVLTPHFLDPIPLDGERPTEPDILRAGAYNAGFLALRRGTESTRFLEWWASRLRTGSRVDTAAGMFVDQRWLDLVPGLFSDVELLDDRGCNVAYWNVAERVVSQHDGSFHADGAVLRFFHFSGFDPENPDRLSRYGTRTDSGSHPVLDALRARYASELEAAGAREARSWSYSWASTGGGIALTPVLRELLDMEDAPVDSIFTPEGERTWTRWLNAPAGVGGGDGVTRFLAALHASRDDLRERFSDLRSDGHAYVEWIEQAGREDPDIPSALRPLPATSGADAAGLYAVRAGDDLGFERPDAVVCIPLYGAHDFFVRCLSSVLAHTPRSVPVLIADDAGPEPASRRFAEELARTNSLEHRVLWLRHDENLGFVENVNAAFALCSPADVVVVNSDCVVASGWFEGMRHAAYSDTNVATATALTNHGTIVTLPVRNVPRPDLPQDVDFLACARKVRAESLRLRPRIPTCVGHCLYVRRVALDLVGPFDPAFSPAYGEEVDFAQRCALHGLVHVVADDVLVLHRQGGSLSKDGEPSAFQRAHHEIIKSRYPFYERLQNAAGAATHSPLARTLANARRSFEDLFVTIDGRSLGPVPTGTQLHVLELVAAVQRTGGVRLRVVVPTDLGEYAREALASANVTLIAETEIWTPGLERSGVMHRPQQVTGTHDLRLMAHLADRSVITQQDLIAYRNPGYFPSFPQFEHYRSLARRALTLADAVVFFSHHAARDAVVEELVAPDRAHVAYIGVDHRVAVASAEPCRPEGCEALGDQEMLFCLGTDFRHKNRLFCLRIVEQLQLRYGWAGRLILAGPRVQHGSSAGDEAAFLATRPRLAEAVIGLPAVTSAEKAWLFARATALLYPTVYEGFGLMPFEAADFGVPALWSAQASLGEVLPSDAQTLVAWDPVASADAVIDVLRDPARAEALVATVRRAAERFRWDATGRKLVSIYLAAATGPAREARLLAIETNDLEFERAGLERKYAELLGGFTDDARRLVGSGGLLSAEQQHVLRRALEHGAPLSAFSAALALVGRIRKSGGRQDPPPTDPQQLRLHWEWLNRNHMDEHLADVEPLVLTPEPS
jgi:GT2 family glycosyltransferase/glycosyltransferase involved in cell wall biosynthesis